MKKIGLICLALVFALGGLGVGYAHWIDSVTITETVSTGTVCVGIRDIGTNDSGTHGVPGNPASYLEGNLDPGWDSSIPEYVTYDKNVASTNSTNGTWKCSHGGDSFYDSVTETIDNAYPSYAPEMTIEVANCGSIPVKVTGMSESHDNADLNPYVELKKWDIYLNGVFQETGSGETELGVAIYGMQIDPCDVVKIIITKHIIQEINGVLCPQGQTINFTETVTFVQWNMFEK